MSLVGARAPRVTFGDFSLDRSTRQLRRGTRELRLEPKAFELLDLLLARRPAAVSKSEIQTELWPDSFVSDGNITGLVTQIRQALEDDRAQSRFVRTVHGFGYAFCGHAVDVALAVEERPSGLPARRPAYSVIWQQRVMALEPGENVLGRAEDAAARIDAPGVSRHHARIVIRKGQALLEDIGSKNGTHFEERRLEGPIALRDGDRFRLGSQVLVFRCAPTEGAATETEG
jgi:DNA-binding winged helix-turn-helix (wHTH) protein